MQILKNKNFLLTIVLIIPFLIYPQNETFEVLKADMIQKSIVFKSQPNYHKAYYYFINKNWDSTLVYASKQLSSSKNKEITDYCHFFIGYSLNEKKAFQKSQSELNLISDNFLFSPLVDIILGDISLEIKEFNKAIQQYKKAKKLAVSNKKGYRTSILYKKTGESYLGLNRVAEAKKYFIKSLKLLEKEKDTSSLADLHMDLATVYNRQLKHTEACFYFNKGYILSKTEKGFEQKMKATNNRANQEEKRGDFKQALAYRKESDRWKDSLNIQNKKWNIADFNKNYEIALKQNQIDQLKDENKSKNKAEYSYSYIATALFFIIIGGSFVYYKHVKGTTIILRQKNKLDEINSTKDLLLTIVSHDLRAFVNALKTSNSKLIESLETKNYNKLDQLLYQNSTITNGAYNLLDNILHWVLLQTKELYFQKDSAHLFSIVEQIEYNYKALLTEKKISYNNSVSKNSFIEVDIDSLKIVLRNLFDNAIKFSDFNGKISIYTQETSSDFWELIIEDNGSGIDQNTIDELLGESELVSKKRNSEIKGTGLGIQLCKQMIKKNKGKLDIKSETNIGTKIIISLPKTV